MNSTAAVLVVHAPAAAIVADDAIGMVRAPRGGPEPAVIVEVRRDWHFRQGLRQRELAEHGADPEEVTDPSVPDDRRGLAEGGVRALLGTRLQDTAATARCFDEHASLADRERERLLAVHVLAGEQRGLGDGGVPVIGRADEHRVDISPRQQILEAAMDRGRAAGTVDLCDAVLQARRCSLPNIT
jgi:hypothetical protein